MKIALLSYEYPPETGFGGIGTYTWYHARALVKLGHEVHVLAGSNNHLRLQTSQQDSVFVHRYRPRGVWMALAGLFGGLCCYWTKQRLENAWCMYRGLKLLMKQHRFDVIEMPECGAEGLLINWLVNIPKVVRFHSPARLIMPYYRVTWLDFLICPWIENLAIRKATALSSPSRFLANEVRVRMGVEQHVAFVPYGIDLALFDREPIPQINGLHGLPEGKVTILFLGRMEWRKGIQLCGEIAKSVLRRRDVIFLFAGEDRYGYMQNTLLPFLDEQKLLGSFRYLGKLGLQQVRACVRSVDILLLPSLWENCPYSCLEAMAAGRAIVATDQGGIPELIQHGSNGLLAKAGSPESFAAQLKVLIDDPAMRRALGTAARQTVEQHYLDTHIADQTADLYRDSINRLHNFDKACVGN
jgi:glycogen(starch) synthase